MSRACRLLVAPSTGGHIEVRMRTDGTVADLKAQVAERLGLRTDKIVLLHRNRQLTSGSLLENGIADGSRLTLLPNVETGITAQNPEQCVLQALETLDTSQVDSFLCGRLPLNLTMRLGDHMMFIQLQLATDAPPTTPPTPPPSPLLLEKEAPPHDTQVLSEASRNLTRTLRQLSSAAMANKMKENCNGRCCVSRREGGAVIESMLHHGRGVFSGTFSGTLSPVLQDEGGRPRRDICTVVHILNDLLGASSHCTPCCKGGKKTTPSNSSSSSTAQKQQHAEEGRGNNAEEERSLRAKVSRLQHILKQRRRRHPYGRREEFNSEPAVA